MVLKKIFSKDGEERGGDLNVLKVCVEYMYVSVLEYRYPGYPEHTDPSRKYTQFMFNLC